MLQGLRLPWPGAADGSKWLLELAPEPQLGDIAAQACSVGLAGALDSAAQADSDEETCAKASRKRYAGVVTRSGNLALFVYAWTCSGPYVYLKGYALCRQALLASSGCDFGGSVPPF